MGSLATQDVLDRAHERAQRRFRRMLTEQTYGDPTNKQTRLYIQAERLVDSLLTEIAWARAQIEMERLQLNDPDAPDYFGAMVAESELRSMWGDR